MTVVRPNSISGINSITVATGEALSIHGADGALVSTLTNTSGIATYKGIHVGSGTTTANQGVLVGTGASIVSDAINELSIYTNNTERVNVTSSGELVINNSSADSSNKLQIYGSQNDDVSVRIKRTNAIASNNLYGALEFVDNNNADIAYVKAHNEGGATASYLTLGTYGSGSLSEKVRITAAGAVGINSTSPTANYKLDVNGDLTLGEAKGTDNTYIDQKQDGDLHIINSGRTSNGATGTSAGGMGINRYNDIAGGTSLFRDFTVYNGKNAKVLSVDGSVGYVGIGTDTPGRELHIVGGDGPTNATIGNSDTQLVIDNKGGNGAIIEFLTENNSAGRIFFTDPDASNQGGIEYEHTGNIFKFRTAGGEKMRFGGTGSGAICWGNTGAGPHGGYFNIDASASSTNGLNIVGTTGNYCVVSASKKTSGDHIYFSNYSSGSSTNTGTIQDNGSNVSYNTSSDYRLKENVVTISDGITRVKQLNPVRHTWKNNSGIGTVDGWIAHELDAVCPYAVIGTKDATNEDGSIAAQTVDYAKISPLLAAALKEAIAKIETLESKVAALESA